MIYRLNNAGKYLLALACVFSFLLLEVSPAAASQVSKEKPGSKTAKAGSIRLATFNIRSNYGSDKQDWKTRRVSLDSLLRMYDFDIIGVQEPYQRQIDEMAKSYGHIYDHYVVNTLNSHVKPTIHSNPIFYKKDRFKLLKSGAFWFSETPDVAGSVSWEASQARNCVWVELYDKENKVSFFVFNSHFDHKSTVARSESAKILIEKVRSIAGKSPIICTGDFNTNQTTKAFSTLSDNGLLVDAHAVAKKVVNDDYKTSHGYTVIPPAVDTKRIDHIFISGKSFSKKVNLWKCCVENFDGKWASDHYPVFIDFDF